MKIRTDFVTNSSSANYVVEFQLKSTSDQVASYYISTQGSPEYEGQEPYQVLFKWGWPIKGLDLWHPFLPEDGRLEDIISALIGCVEVTPYPEGFILDQMSFFIVGEPTKYASREDLANVIERNGGKVTGLWDADFVILCGDAKEHFCERWPWGYSIDALDDAEQDELYAAEDVIESEICKAGRAAEGSDFSIVFCLYTGSQEERDDSARDGWRGWTVNDWLGEPLPAMSEEEFAFFDPNGPAGRGGLTAMPGAVEAFAKKCAEAGITRENLRIIGGRFSVHPFGDSWWEVEPREYQWCVNLQSQQSRSSSEWAWQDTAWWPFEGKAVGVPYASVTSHEVDRSKVRHLDLSEFRGAHITDMRQMFANFDDLQDLDLSSLDTSLVTDMSWLFSFCMSLRSLDLSHFDTSHVTDMSGMFRYCEDLMEIDLSGFDTSKLTTTHEMFRCCECLESLDLSSFDAALVTNTKDMFAGCNRLKKWIVNASWPVELEGAIPAPTAKNEMWWSARDGRWMSVREIRDRGPVADTYTSATIFT